MEALELEEKGITVVYFSDGDPDHGSVYDAPEEDEEEEDEQ